MNKHKLNRLIKLLMSRKTNQQYDLSISDNLRYLNITIDGRKAFFFLSGYDNEYAKGLSIVPTILGELNRMGVSGIEKIDINWVNTMDSQYLSHECHEYFNERWDEIGNQSELPDDNMTPLDFHNDCKQVNIILHHNIGFDHDIALYYVIDFHVKTKDKIVAETELELALDIVDPHSICNFNVFDSHH